MAATKLKNGNETKFGRLVRLFLIASIFLSAFWVFYSNPDMRLSTTAFHIWFPVLVGFACFFFVQPKTRTGGYMLTLTLFLVLVSLFAGDWSINILRASPLFFSAIIFIGFLRDRFGRA